MSAGQSGSISNTSSSSDISTRRDAGTERSRPPDSDVQRFERLMERREGGGSSSQMEDWERKRLLAQIDAPMMGAQSAAQAATSAATPPPSAAQPLDELIAKYVQMMAISDPSAAGDPRLMMKLDANLLPQTELFLVKAPDGWVLQANTRSPEAYRMLSEFGPALERRFAARKLGALRVEANLQPSAIAPAK